MPAHRVIEKAEIVLRIGVIGSEAYLFFVGGQSLFRISAVEVRIAKPAKGRRIIWIEANRDLVSFDRLRVLLVRGEFVSLIYETGGFACGFLWRLATSLRGCIHSSEEEGASD